MKKIIFLFVATLGITLLTTSCNKENTSDTDQLISDIAEATNKVAVQPEDLPAPALETIENNYFETVVEEAYLANQLGYEVNMINGEALYFDTDGTELRGRRGRHHGHGPCGFGPRFGDPVNPADLPAAITDYINDNYTNPEIKKAKTNDNGAYFVLVKTDDGPVVIKFDADGNYLNEVSCLHHHCRGLTLVDIADLPTSITDYITDNYPNAEVKRAAQKNNNGRYFVFINDDGDRKILVFDEDGNFLFERG